MHPHQAGLLSRLVAALLLLSLLSLAVVRPSERNPVVRAAHATTGTSTARAELTVEHGTQTSTAEGAVDFRSERSRFAFSGPHPHEVLTEGSVVYLKAPVAGFGDSAQGKPWVAIDYGGLGNLPLLSLSSTRNPMATLRMLEDGDAFGPVERVGNDEVRGVHAVHYRAAVEPRGIGDVAVPTVPGVHGTLDVWVADDGLLRRVEVTSTMPARNPLPEVRSRVRVDLFDYGAEVQIALPPEDQVFRQESVAKLLERQKQ